MCLTIFFVHEQAVIKPSRHFSIQILPQCFEKLCILWRIENKCTATVRILVKANWPLTHCTVIFTLEIKWLYVCSPVLPGACHVAQACLEACKNWACTITQLNSCFHFNKENKSISSWGNINERHDLLDTWRVTWGHNHRSTSNSGDSGPAKHQVIEMKRMRLSKANWKIHLGENEGSGVERRKKEFFIFEW